MSLDFPFYQELRRRNHRAAKWWLIGDRLYYFGALCVVLGFPFTLISLLTALLDSGWNWFLFSASTFVGGVLVFHLGGFLKGLSYRLAERDGISVNDY